MLERVAGEAAAAALVLGPVAVDELLLGQRHELLRRDEVGALDAGDRRERPATSSIFKY